LDAQIADEVMGAFIWCQTQTVLCDLWKNWCAIFQACGILFKRTCTFYFYFY